LEESLSSVDEVQVILLTHGGADKVLARLCELDCVTLTGIFIELGKPPQRSLPEKIRRSIRYDGYLPTIAKLFQKLLRSKYSFVAEGDSNKSLEKLREIAELHGVPVHEVLDYHDAESIALMRSENPDLAVVFGTNILKESVFNIPKLGAINFHHGLVPFYRGGPPIFWELFNDEKEVGLTVHWITQKVDAGDVIIQHTEPLNYDYSFDTDFESFISQYRERLTDKCAQLIAEAIRLIALGDSRRTPQEASLGKRYRLPTKKEKDELRRRLGERKRRAVKSTRSA
jgi:folate-dependent phosphoribosylglycinamide formyltransferase PurN